MPSLTFKTLPVHSGDSVLYNSGADHLTSESAKSEFFITLSAGCQQLIEDSGVTYHGFLRTESENAARKLLEKIVLQKCE